jgi:S1-C subfamily serine protease
MTLLKTVLLPLLLGSVLAAGDGWLGVFMADSESEARIAEVIPGSPADLAGLRRGDVLLQVNGIETGTVETLAAAIQGCAAGERVRLQVRRGQEEFPIEVLLGVRPGASAQDPTPSARPFLGVGVVEGERGLTVSRVLVDSPAAQVGVRPGDRLVRVDGRAVGDFEDLDQVMAGLVPGSEIALNLESERGSASLLIRLGARPAAPNSGAGPGESTEDPATPTAPDLEDRLSQAELYLERLDRQMRVVEELRSGLQELQQLQDELRELRQVLAELLRRDR